MWLELEIDDFDVVVQDLAEISPNVDPSSLLSTAVYIVDEIACGIRKIYLDEDPSSSRERVEEAVYDLLKTLLMSSNNRRPSPTQVKKLYEICEQLVRDIISQLELEVNWITTRVSMKKTYINPRSLQRISMSVRALPLGDASPEINDMEISKDVVNRFITAIIRNQD